jgi:hypothetical protein
MALPGIAIVAFPGKHETTGIGGLLRAKIRAPKAKLAPGSLSD